MALPEGKELINVLILKYPPNYYSFPGSPIHHFMPGILPVLQV